MHCLIVAYTNFWTIISIQDISITRKEKNIKSIRTMVNVIYIECKGELPRTDPFGTPQGAVSLVDIIVYAIRFELFENDLLIRLE